MHKNKKVLIGTLGFIGLGGGIAWILIAKALGIPATSSWPSLGIFTLFACLAYVAGILFLREYKKKTIFRTVLIVWMVLATIIVPMQFFILLLG